MRERRFEANPSIVAELSEDDAALAREGRIREGMPKQGVFLAWGRPDDVRQGSKSGVPYETWHYTNFRAHSRTHLSLGYGYGLDPYYPYYRGRYYRHPHFGFHPSVSTTYIPVKTGSVEFLNDKVVSWETSGRQ